MCTQVFRTSPSQDTFMPEAICSILTRTASEIAKKGGAGEARVGAVYLPQRVCSKTEIARRRGLC